MLVMLYEEVGLIQMIDMFQKNCKNLPANIWCPCNSINLITLVLRQCQFCNWKPSLMNLVKFPYLHNKYREPKMLNPPNPIGQRCGELCAGVKTLKYPLLSHTVCNICKAIYITQFRLNRH